MIFMGITTIRSSFIKARSLVMLMVIISFIAVGCSKNKFSCDAYGSSYKKKHKKNRNNYGALYSPKSKPVPKNYNLKQGK